MAGTVAQSLLTRTRFGLAQPGDHAEVRRILREHAMAGAIRLSIEPPLRDDDALVHQVIVGRREGGGLFGVGIRAVRKMYINGCPTAVGYLSALRLDSDYRNNPRVLLRAYEYLHELHVSDGACGFYLTSIMSENFTARRMLEANVRGMPTYQFLGEFATLVMSVRPATVTHQTVVDEIAVRELIDRCASRYQFAAVIPLDPPFSESLRVLHDDRAKIKACGALWEYPTTRTIVRGYSPALRFWRPAHNVLARITNWPRLPEIGQPLRLGYIAQLAQADLQDHQSLCEVIAALHDCAARRGIDYLVAGFDARDPRLPLLRRRFGGRMLRSRLYAVYWPDGADAVAELDERPLGPEVALL